MKKMIPIFIITCDRLEVLKKSMQSYYDYIKIPFEIVIVDFGSTYEPTVKFLRHLEYKKIKVYWEKKITTPHELNNVGRIIQSYFKDCPANNYIVTDSDVALDDVAGDILDVYDYLLEALPHINVVAPMLRIDDIPDYYPEKEKLINGKKGLHKRFHLSKINNIQYKNKTIQYIVAPVDTTFGMFRKGESWMRLMRGIRVLAPYSAKHLDWYLDPDNLTRDQKYYMEHASRQIAHWSMGMRDKWHPYGNIDPFKIPKTADKVLNEFLDISEGLGIQPFLLYGTCLGFVRESGYIEGDNDIDVGVLGGLDKLTKELVKNRFINKRTLGQATRHFFKDGILLDVWFGFLSHRFLQSFDKVIYKGRFFNAPHPVEEFLGASYGNWQIKILDKKASRC